MGYRALPLSTFTGHRGGHRKTGTDTGGKQASAQERLGPPEARRGKAGVSPGASGGLVALKTPDLGLSASGTMRTRSCCFKPPATQLEGGLEPKRRASRALAARPRGRGAGWPDRHALLGDGGRACLMPRQLPPRPMWPPSRSAEEGLASPGHGDRRRHRRLDPPISFPVPEEPRLVPPTSTRHSKPFRKHHFLFRSLRH